MLDPGNELTAAPKTVVTLNYATLSDKSADVSDKLEAGFGPLGLGIIAISEVPGFPQLRKRLLPLAQRLATLPIDVRTQLEDPLTRYSFGWSHGKEKLEEGRPDLMKGSFYANLCKDIRTTSTELLQRYPSQCGNNVWPHKHLPELQQAMMELGSLIMQVGFLLAHHCDKYVANRSTTKGGASLEQILRRSECHKGRLLHYFPQNERYPDEDASAWCGWHRDISSLTGLVPALYTRDSKEVPCPDPEAGLYIQNREGLVVKAVYSSDHLAFQIGETTELLSGTLFHATPHYVKAPGRTVLGVARNSFAVFMQPHWDEPLNVDVNSEETVNQVPGGHVAPISFGDFAESRILGYNYEVAT